MMNIKQLINLKFFDHLGKTPIEELKLLQEVYGDKRCQELSFLSGTEDQRGKRRCGNR